MTIDRHIPAITPDPDTAAFWQAAGRGRLVLPRCRNCGKRHWYPRGICPFCLSADITWEDSPGLGRVYSVTVFRQSRGGEDIAIAYVELDEGPRLLTNILTDDPASVSIGQRVEVIFVSASENPEQKHPFFCPVSEG